MNIEIKKEEETQSSINEFENQPLYIDPYSIGQCFLAFSNSLVEEDVTNFDITIQSLIYLLEKEGNYHSIVKSFSLTTFAKVFQLLICYLSDNHKNFVKESKFSTYFLYKSFDLGMIPSFEEDWVRIYLDSKKKQTLFIPTNHIHNGNEAENKEDSQNIQNGSMFTDIHGNILWADKTSCWLFERSFSELLSLNFIDLMTDRSKNVFSWKFPSGLFQHPSPDQLSEVLSYSINKRFVSTSHPSLAKRPKVVTSRLTLVLISEHDKREEKPEVGLFIQSKLAPSETWKYFIGGYDKDEIQMQTPSFPKMHS